MQIQNPSIDKIANLTDNGFVKTGSGNGTLSVDTVAYAPVSTVRERLAADRTYYVRTDGSDSNNGLTNTAGGAFLTIQHAVTVYQNLDCNGHNVTIQVGNGTYNESVQPSSRVGAGELTIKGDTTTPSNVEISNANPFYVAGHPPGSTVHIQGFKLSPGTNGFAISALNGSKVNFKNILFNGSSSGRAVDVTTFAVVSIEGNIEITGSWTFINVSTYAGYIQLNGAYTVTLTSTPSWSNGFAYAEDATLVSTGLTFSGASTGLRYNSVFNAVIQTFGGGANYFPGNSAGTTSTGGQYG